MNFRPRTANDLLMMPKPQKWSDQDELAYRNKIMALAMRERDPNALGTQQEMQELEWESREADAKFGYGSSAREDKRIEESQIRAIISEILRR